MKTDSVLQLPQVTLCCVDTRMPALALHAMRQCMKNIHFGNALLFTSPQHELKEPPSDIKIIRVEGILNIADYSRFLIKDLLPYLHTSHMLIMQWDGYVLSPEAWTDEFLYVDYIGAVWPQYSDGHRVGNGGFSLRSKKLLNALQSNLINPTHPEDVCIARDHHDMLKNQMGIQFADERLARQFSFEREQPSSQTFGFHGLSNMARILSEAELHQFMSIAPASLFGSVEARGFIKNLIKRNLKSMALTAMKHRRSIHSTDFADIRLWIRLALASWQPWARIS